MGDAAPGGDAGDDDVQKASDTEAEERAEQYGDRSRDHHPGRCSVLAVVLPNVLCMVTITWRIVQGSDAVPERQTEACLSG